MNLAAGYYTLTVIDYEPKSLRSRRGFSGVMDSGCTDGACGCMAASRMYA